MPRLPLDGTVRITSAYGYRTDPISGAANSWHGGLDMVADDRTIRAAAAGTVAVSQIITDTSNKTWEWGNYVAVLTDDGHVIYYCHMASRAVTAGQRVEAGDKLGVMGATGRSTGVHLHFEVRTTQNKQINAADYLGIANEIGTLAAESTTTTAAGSYSDAAVKWAQEKGIMLGDGSGDLMLDRACTRREVATMLYRALGGST